MWFRLLADLAVVLHAAFIVCVVIGGVVALRYRWFAVVHLPVAAWGVFISVTGRVCPLTYVENSLRARAGDHGYAGGFIDHYLTSLIYPDGLTRTHQYVMAAVVLLLNLAVYWRYWQTRTKPVNG